MTTGYNDYYVFDSSMNYAANQIQTVEAQRRAIRRGEQAQGSADARGIMRDIQSKTTDLRRKMTERYMIEFTDTPPRTSQK